MAISYPRDLPTNIGFAQVTLRAVKPNINYYESLHLQTTNLQSYWAALGS
jgi:hypothetical protein